VEATDRTGKTALHYCAENQTPTCADVLLNHSKTLLDVQDNEGYSTLHLAVIAGNNLFIKYLISKGADLNLLDCELHSVVHWATGQSKKNLSSWK
jgi:ankyrin repeat protein